MKTQNDVRVTIRVDRELKEQAEMLFARLGLNMSTAFNVFLRKSVDESAIPFPLSIKQTDIGYGISANDVSEAFTTAVREDITENMNNGFPIARYDAEKKQAYLEVTDGTREYIDDKT